MFCDTWPNNTHTRTHANIDYYSESFALRRPKTLMSMSIHNYIQHMLYYTYLIIVIRFWQLWANCTLQPFWHRKLYSSDDPPTTHHPADDESSIKFKLLHSNIVINTYTKSPKSPHPNHMHMNTM